MYVRRDGTGLLRPDGSPTLFRGVGIGNWLLPEGYMWGFQKGADSPRRIEAFVARVAGTDWAPTFWSRFREVFFTEADVARIAALGLDHVRLPLNARHLLTAEGELSPEGIAPVDDCVRWCARHGLLVVLDLHAAPGGQTGANIDDSLADHPDLFTDPAMREACVRLWTLLARRFADEPTIMAYDLLNEPLRDEFADRHSDDLRSLYLDLTAAIRAEDPHHLIMYEGPHWATRTAIFDGVWDENSLVQFHHYWADPSSAGIVGPLAARDRLGLPLYLGETGENTDEWVHAMLRTAEREDVSWNFWPWKKIATTTSPADIAAPAGWNAMVAAAEGSGPDPRPDEARAMLEAVLAAAPLAACRWDEDLVRAIVG